MKQYQAHKSSLFLMELIIAIVFFALASSVCLQLFVKSHLLSEETRNLNAATNIGISAAESIRQSKGSKDSLQEFLPQLTASDSDTFTAYYDSDWNIGTKENSAYCLEIQLQNQDTMSLAKVRIFDTQTEKTIYELPVQVHIPYTYDGKGESK